MPRSRRPNLTQVKSIAYQPLEKNNISLRDDELLDTHFKPIKIGDKFAPIELSTEALKASLLKCDKLETNDWNELQYDMLDGETIQLSNIDSGGGFALSSATGSLSLYSRAADSFKEGDDDPVYAQFDSPQTAVTSPAEILTLTNWFNTSATMTGTGPAIAFNQAYYVFGGGDTDDTGQIGFFCQQNWTATASTRDSSFEVKNSLNGSLQTCFKVSASLHTSLYGDVSIPATSQLLFDGSGSGHTYITESSDDILDFYVGTDKMLSLDEANDKIIMAATNWVAGTVSGDTVTEFSAANSSYAGMVLGYTRLQGDLSTQGVFEIQNSVTVEDSTHQITFKTPPSENVEIQATFILNALSTDSRVVVGLSDNSTYNSIGVQFEYDSQGISFGDDEVDDGVRTVQFVLGASELASVGSSNTFYIGFGTAGATKSIYLQYGVRATHGIADHPFVIKATALPATIYDGL